MPAYRFTNQKTDLDLLVNTDEDLETTTILQNVEQDKTPLSY
jgi:hypothetical protein